jgi:hypothetical protein
MRHWAEPSAPSQEGEARYRRAVASGLSQADFEAAEAVQARTADAAMNARIDAARAKGEIDAARWDAIYRAAVCSAAQAISARDWTAKRQALAVADQADAARQPMMAALFGRPKEIPAQYAALERAGATLTREDSSAALRVIAADHAAMRAQHKPGVR